MCVVHLGQRLLGIRHTENVNKNAKFTFNWHGRQNFEYMWQKIEFESTE